MKNKEFYNIFEGDKLLYEDLTQDEYFSAMEDLAYEFYDNGSHGSMSGSYALKISTKPKKDSQNVTLKRITFVKACNIQFECFFTFKPEASKRKLLDTDVKSIGILLDLQNDQNRVMPHLRYLNSYNGERKEEVDFSAAV